MALTGKLGATQIRTIGFWVIIMAGVAGCAPPPAVNDTKEGWPEARRLGAELEAYRPVDPPKAGNVASVRLEEPTGVLTLRAVLAQALLKNPELAVFSWEVRAADARILQAGLIPNPEFGAEVENFGGSAERRGVSSAESTIALSQLIELGGKREKRTRVARLERDLAGWDFEAKRLDVYVATAKAFMQTLAAQRRVALKQQQLALSRRVLEIVRERVEAGRASSVEQTRAEVELASSRIESQRAKRELQVARSLLAANWGSTEPKFTEAEGPFEDIPLLPALDQLLGRLADNPELRRSDTDFALRRSALELERARDIPDVNVSAGMRRFEDSADNAFVAGVSIPIPVFGLNPGGVLEAERRLPQTRERQRATMVRVNSELRQTHREGTALFDALVGLTNDVLPGAQKAFEATQQAYRQGKFDFLEVLDAQRTLFAAHERYIETAAAYHSATFDIERLIGRPLGPSRGRNE